MKIKSIIFSAILVFTTTTAYALETANLEISISGARSKLGHVLVLVFNDSDPKAFPDKVDKAVVQLKLTVDEAAKFVIEQLPVGHYAITMVHDENDNGNVDKNSVGVPTEGFGFSNDAMGTFGPPSFEKAKIKVSAPVSQTAMKMKHF
jgi:uncharacterized protein (DUF2141 family)